MTVSIGCWLWGSHSQQCPGGLALLGSLSDQQDHPSLGPQGDQGHPEMKGGVSSHNLSRDCGPSEPHWPRPCSPPPRSSPPALTDLGPFLPRCSRQSLLSRRSWGARVTSLPHGTAFSSCSLGKAQSKLSSVCPKTPLCVPQSANRGPSSLAQKPRGNCCRSPGYQ